MRVLDARLSQIFIALTLSQLTGYRHASAGCESDCRQVTHPMELSQIFIALTLSQLTGYRHTSDVDVV
ncbi:hypothetical protein J6590_068120 [Homalodisca vitripennis]|nr:hypothetical protein J6590_068120 [Homalodisca vitripennis]